METELLLERITMYNIVLSMYNSRLMSLLNLLVAIRPCQLKPTDSDLSTSCCLPVIRWTNSSDNVVACYMYNPML